MKNPFFLVGVMLWLTIFSGLGAELTPVFQDSTHQLTGVAISKTGRMFVNFPRWQEPHAYDVVEVLTNQEVRPYPDANWNSWSPGKSGMSHWICVQAVYVDATDRLWVVDPAAPEMKKVQDHGAKVVSIDLQTDHVLRTYNLSTLVGNNSYLNDIRVDCDRGVAYLTESKNGGIVVLNIRTGKSRLVLNKHYSVKSDPSRQLTIDGQILKRDGKPFKGNSDGIALSPDRQWLYYKALSDTKLYRVNTADLCNAGLSAKQLEAKVQDLGTNFTASDGMIFDSKGNLFLSDSEHSSIVRVTPDLKWSSVIQDGLLIWPDTFAWSPDGFLYVTCSQIQNMPWCNNGKSTRVSPYTIYKINVQE